MSDTTNCLVCGKNIDVQVALYNTGKPNCCDNCAVERRGEYKLQEIKLAISAVSGTEANTAQRVKAMRDIQANHLEWLAWLIEQLEQAQTENERILQQNQKLVESLETVFPYIGNIGDSSLIGSLKEHADRVLTEVLQE